MWKELKSECILIVHAKSYLLFIPYVLYYVFLIVKKENDRSLLVMISFMNPLLISANFHYMGKQGLHYEESRLKNAIAARYVYYTFITIVEYLVGVACSSIGTDSSQGVDITLLEGFYITIVLSLGTGAILFPYAYAKNEETIMQRVLRVYIVSIIIFVVAIIAAVSILYLLFPAIDNFTIRTSTRHMLDLIAIGCMMIAVIAFVYSYFLSCKRYAKRLALMFKEVNKEEFKV